MRPNAPLRGLTAFLGSAYLVVALGGCSAESDMESRRQGASQSQGTPTASTTAHARPSDAVRTDPAPIKRRFVALGDPLRVSWQAGIFGDQRVPGPSSYWIDAVVTLQPEIARKLRNSGALASTAPPTVTADLRGALPHGSWLTGADLDRVVSGTSNYSCHAYLAKDTDVIVLIAEGSNG